MQLGESRINDYVEHRGNTANRTAWRTPKWAHQAQLHMQIYKLCHMIYPIWRFAHYVIFNL